MAPLFAGARCKSKQTHMKLIRSKETIMKRFCLFISTVVLFVLCLVLMSSSATELDAPKNFKFDMAKQILSWDQSRGASGYTIVIGTEEVVTRSTSYSLENLEAGEYVIRIKANGDGENTKDSEFTEYPFTREYETGLRYKLINNNQEYQLVGIGTATAESPLPKLHPRHLRATRGLQALSSVSMLRRSEKRHFTTVKQWSVSRSPRV